MIGRKFRYEGELFLLFGLFEKHIFFHNHSVVKNVKSFSTKLLGVSLSFTMVLMVKDNDSVNLREGMKKSIKHEHYMCNTACFLSLQTQVVRLATSHK